MNYINKILTGMSIIGILTAFNRFNAFTRIAVGPFEFLRIQEINHIFILFFGSVILTFLLFIHYFTKELLTNRYFILISILYITGVYFYSVGVGMHELANYMNIKYCIETTTPLTNCSMIEFNDDIFSHILWYIGFILGTVTLVIAEYISKKNVDIKKYDIPILYTNALILALGVFGNTAFEDATPDIIITITMVTILAYFFIKGTLNKNKHLFATYVLVAFGVGASFTSLVYLLG